MQYVIFSFFLLIFIIVLAIEMTDARQKKIAFSTYDPNTFNHKNITLTKKCPGCGEEIATDTAVCKHCGAFVCYFWYRS